MSYSYFIHRFQKRPTPELLRMLDQPKTYTKEAIVAAIDVLEERGVDLSVAQQQLKQELAEDIPKERPTAMDVSLATKRVVALVLDIIVLSACSYVIGFSLMGTHWLSGWKELAISFTLILGYFSILNSNLIGSSVGKQLMKINVLNYDLTQLTFGQTLLRYLVLFAPFLFIKLGQQQIDSLAFLWSWLKIAYAGALILVFFTDKKLDRSIHDLVTKSFVRPRLDENNLEDGLEEVDKSFSPVSLKIYSLVVGIALIGLCVIEFYPKSQPIIARQEIVNLTEQLERNADAVNSIVAAIQKVDGVNGVIEIELSKVNGKQSLNVFIVPNSAKFTLELAEKVRAAVNEYPLKVRNLRELNVIQRHGFNMTLASFNTEMKHTFEL